MLAGTHRSWQFDNSITNTTEAAALTTQMLDMQSGAIHLKEVPVFWSGIYGDFNGDGSLTAADIDIITRKVENRSNNGYNWYLDWDGDGDHDTDDVISYVEDVHTFHTKVGDTDLDGDVDINDLIECGTFNSDNHWAIGDLNGDGITDVDDFNLAAANYPWTRP